MKGVYVIADAPRIVTVPYTTMPDLMLQRLGLRKVEYHLEQRQGGRVRVPVFSTPRH